MKKLLYSCMALLMVLCLTSGAEARKFSVTTATGDTVEISDDGEFSGYRKLIEVVATSDTVTTGESGKVFLVNVATGNITFTLPAAEDGLVYTFTAINGGVGATQGEIWIDPAAADTMVGCVNSKLANTFSAGDKLASPATTGDSVTIVGRANGTWICTDMVGTWTDDD